MSCVLWCRFQRLLDNLGNLRIGNDARTACAIFVRQAFYAMLGKSPAPFPDCMLGMTKFRRHLFAGQTFRTFQHNPAPVKKRPFRLAPAQLRFQKTPLLITHFNHN